MRKKTNRDLAKDRKEKKSWSHLHSYYEHESSLTKHIEPKAEVKKKKSGGNLGFFMSGRKPQKCSATKKQRYVWTNGSRPTEEKSKLRNDAIPQTWGERKKRSANSNDR